MKNGYVQIDDSRIYYEIDGSGFPLVFVHADALDSRQWDSQFEYFSNRYKVIRFDLRSFGKSDIPGKTPYSFSEDINKLLEALSITKAHFLGLSLGAAEILNLYLGHPDKVCSMVLADAGISGDGFNQDFKDNIGTIVKLAKAGDLEAARKAWSELSIFDVSRKIPAVWVDVQKMVADTSGYRWYGENQPISPNPPASTRLSEIKVPTLILIGETDIPDFQRKAKLLRQQIPNSKHIAIPNAGHLSNLDNPVRFNEEVGLFLSNLD